MIHNLNLQKSSQVNILTPEQSISRKLFSSFRKNVDYQDRE